MKNSENFVSMTVGADNVAHITIDDGKVNAMTASLLQAISHALYESAETASLTIIQGRTGIFSAGFDLKTLNGPEAEAHAMVTAGIELLDQCLSHPHPIVTVCTGHAFPMGALIVLASDIRIGVEGDHRMGLNEVALGITLGRWVLGLAEQRLSGSGLSAALTGQLLTPEAARAAGYLDHVVAADQLDDHLGAVISQLAELNGAAFHGTKTRLNGKARKGLMRGAADDGYQPVTSRYAA